MQYETIILELMARIKTLENDVADMKTTVQSLEAAVNSVGNPDLDIDVDSPDAAAPTPSALNTTTYTKTTEHMMDACYTYGKKAYRTPDANIGDYADLVAVETGMNRNSAFMYIYGVKNLLEGKVFKRAISIKALRKYFSAIYEEFGKTGLANAIQATRANVEYRQSYNLPSESIIALCNEFQKKI